MGTVWVHPESPSKTAWRLPPEGDLTLDSGALHVWHASLNLHPEQCAVLAQTLAPEELERAERLRIPGKRHQFIAARAVLRTILARYVGRAPNALSFCYGPQGKPAITAPAPPIQFNLSHAEDLALCAVARQAKVGIDLERIDPQRPILDIARRFFSPNEARDLEALPETQRVDAFYRCWTCKEAYLKARGRGLHLPLDSFDVVVHPDRAAGLKAVAKNPAEAEKWAISTLPVDPGYAAACALSPPLKDWRFWKWTPGPT